MRSILLLFLLGVGSAASDASEPVPSRPYFTGRIEQDTTWRDTVYVGGDVTIAAAATLTLAPNTQVLFLPYHDATRGGLDTTRAELIVAGLDSLAESRGNMSTGKRVGLKLIAGTVGGVIGVKMVNSILPCFPDDYAGDYDPVYCKSAEAALLYGYPVGIAIGVSLVGPRDRPIPSLIRPLVLSLGGSAVGLIGGILLASVDDEVFWPSVPIFPIVGATLASELWRKPSTAHRVSFALSPTLNGGLSAVAQLRF